ncbi:MAG: efflux RND transporter periplasmic adaptor subunit [Anaerolineae bacterium]
MKTVRTLGIIVLVVVVGLFIVRRLMPEPPSATAQTPTTAPTAEVTRGAIQQTVSASGSLVAESQAGLVVSASGRVEEVLVAEGDTVTKGQELLRLATRSAEEQVARAEASLATTRARLAQAKLPASEAEIAATQATIDSAQAKLDGLLAGPTEYELRTAQLKVDTAKNQLWAAQGSRDASWSSPTGSQGSRDAAEAQVLVAEVAVQQAELALQELQAPPSDEDIAAARAQVDQAVAQMAKLRESPRAEDIAIYEAQVAEAEMTLSQAQAGLADAVLVSPMDGVVVSADISAGEWAAPGSPIIVVASTGEPLVEVLLDEVDVAEVAVGQTALIHLDALPGQEVTGTVSFVAPAATETSKGVAYRVKIAFDAGDLPVHLGMTTQVDIVTQGVADALLVPNQAVTADRETDRYWVNRRTALGATERIEVKIGIRNDDYTQILEGVAAGDTVVLGTLESPTVTLPGFGMPGVRGQ